MVINKAKILQAKREALKESYVEEGFFSNGYDKQAFKNAIKKFHIDFEKYMHSKDKNIIVKYSDLTNMINIKYPLNQALSEPLKKANDKDKFIKGYNKNVINEYSYTVTTYINGVLMVNKYREIFVLVDDILIKVTFIDASSATFKYIVSKEDTKNKPYNFNQIVSLVKNGVVCDKITCKDNVIKISGCNNTSSVTKAEQMGSSLFKNAVVKGNKVTGSCEIKFINTKESATLTPIEKINYIQEFRNRDMDYILENMDVAATIQGTGLDFFNHVIDTGRLSYERLEENKNLIDTLISSSEDGSYKDQLVETSLYLDNKMKNFSNECYNMTNYYVTKLESYRVATEAASPEIDKIINNIKYDENSEEKYKALLHEIETTDKKIYLSSLPKLLVKNTSLVLSSVTLSASFLALVLSVPGIVVAQVIDNKLKEKEVKTYIKLLNKQIGEVYQEMKNGGTEKKSHRDYIEELKKARNELSDSLRKPAKESFENFDLFSVKENIPEMQPDIVASEEEVYELWEESLMKLIFDDKPEFVAEDFTDIIRYTNMADSLLEGKTYDKAVRGATKARAGSNKLAGKTQSAARKVARVTGNIKEIPTAWVNMFNRFIDKMKEMDRNERRERIVTGQFRFKLSNYIIKGITFVAMGHAALTGSIIWAIGTLAAVAIDKTLDAKVRRDIIKELERELDIVNEKIEDSRGDSNKKAKYELMRIKHKLEKDLDRIRYHSDKMIW